MPSAALFAVAKARALITVLVFPLPLPSSTRRPISRAAYATPRSAPLLSCPVLRIVAARCVPWPYGSTCAVSLAVPSIVKS